MNEKRVVDIIMNEKRAVDLSQTCDPVSVSRICYRLSYPVNLLDRERNSLELYFICIDSLDILY